MGIRTTGLLLMMALAVAPMEAATEKTPAQERWSILYGQYDGVERFALQELNRAIQQFLPYVVRTEAAETTATLPDHPVILLGTQSGNRLIGGLVRQKRIMIPDKTEGYTIACLDTPSTAGRKTIVIAGADANGVLYGVEDFNARILAYKIMPDRRTPARMREAFDKMEPFSISESPAVANRGIWTWGYVICNYRTFIDNMARLRMNMLTIWNDCPPLNCREVIDYAHSRGIKIVLGFHWGWGLPNADISTSAGQARIRDIVLNNFRDNYRGLGMDAIYFQTVTEHHNTMLKGQSTAAIVCGMVNDIARELLRENPNLQIQFGLHASSIQEHYTDLKPLDPRVTIVWEDAGTTPYSYDPLEALPNDPTSATLRLGTAEGALEYSKQLALLRPDCPFAMVAKGWTCLDWSNEFEHHGPFLLGERSPVFIRERLRQRRARWDRVNAEWMALYPQAMRFYSAISALAPKGMTVSGLVEDGLFEESIEPSVAIFAQTLWNPSRDAGELLKLSMSPYYRQ